MKNVDFAFKINLAILSLLILLGLIYIKPHNKSEFNSDNAFILLAKLQSFGPRIPDSIAHFRSREFIIQQLRSNGWDVQIQSGQVSGHTYYNILAKKSDQPAKILLGTHYDSRIKADQDLNPLLQELPVPGANDGGSSIAVLLELSRILPRESFANVGLVFFDLEDQGHFESWDWIFGSKEFVQNNKIHPDVMVLLDMVGGYEQVIQPPVNSDQLVYQEIQSTANNLGYGAYFSNPAKFAIIDDHVPFLEAGVHSIDLIDIIDPQWHTTQDDLENVSLLSLQRIGDTLTRWIFVRNAQNGY